MKLRTAVVALCERPENVKVFRDAESAESHIRKHLTDEDQGWSSLLPLGPDELRELSRRTPEEEPELWERAYSAYADYILRTVDFAARRRFHLHLDQTRTQGARVTLTRVFQHLSPDGVRVFCRDGSVRTCFAKGSSRRGASWYHRFAEEWFRMALQEERIREDIVKGKRVPVTDQVKRRCLAGGKHSERTPPTIQEWRDLRADFDKAAHR